MDDCRRLRLIWLPWSFWRDYLSPGGPARAHGLPQPTTSRPSNAPVPAPTVPFDHLLDAPASHLYSHTNHYPQCLPRRPPLPQSPRLLLAPPPMLPISVCRSITPRSAVAVRARLLHRVRRPLLTVLRRYGKGCYHQRESTPSGAS